MATNKELENRVNALQQQVDSLKSSNSSLRDEMVVLQRNYGQLVDDMGSRLKVVHEKLFR